MNSSLTICNFNGVVDGYFEERKDCFLRVGLSRFQCIQAYYVILFIYAYRVNDVHSILSFNSASERDQLPSIQHAISAMSTMCPPSSTPCSIIPPSSPQYTSYQQFFMRSFEFSTHQLSSSWMSPSSDHRCTSNNVAPIDTCFE